MTPQPFARVQLLAEPIPVGEAEHIEPVYIGDPGRDGIDLEDMATALMDLDGGEGA
mgnify:CR=1 FL=1